MQVRTTVYYLKMLYLKAGSDSSFKLFCIPGIFSSVSICACARITSQGDAGLLWKVKITFILSFKVLVVEARPQSFALSFEFYQPINQCRNKSMLTSQSDRRRVVRLHHIFRRRTQRLETRPAQWFDSSTAEIRWNSLAFQLHLDHLR